MTQTLNSGDEMDLSGIMVSPSMSISLDDACAHGNPWQREPSDANEMHTTTDGFGH